MTESNNFFTWAMTPRYLQSLMAFPQDIFVAYLEKVNVCSMKLQLVRVLLEKYTVVEYYRN